MVPGNRVVTGSCINQSWGLWDSANCLLIISHLELMQRKWAAWGPQANFLYAHAIAFPKGTPFKFIFSGISDLNGWIKFGQSVSYLGAFCVHLFPWSLKSYMCWGGIFRVDSHQVWWNYEMYLTFFHYFGAPKHAQETGGHSQWYGGSMEFELGLQGLSTELPPPD